MADEAFAIGFAIGVQSAFGTPNATVAALSGTIDETDGCVLGDAESGDAESGITIPNLESDFREVAVVSGSFSEQADSFLKAIVAGFSIAIPLKGNGATATPAAGEAEPDSGIKAILSSLGLDGANGTAPVYEFTPPTDTTTTYSTIKLWIADLSFVFTDCLVDSGALTFEPGDAGILTANINVGKHDPTTDFADGVTFPTITYGTQSTLAAPAIEGVDFTWGTGHPGAPAAGFSTLTINIANSIETFGDSNVVSTGQRQSQTSRVITVDGTLYLDSADSSFDYDNLTSTSAPTADLTFQVGDVAGATDEINAYKLEVNNLQNKSIKYNRIGTATSVELSGSKATTTAAGGEFKLTYN